MAHLIDRVFLTALAVTLAFAVVLNATGSLPLAMLAGSIAPIPLRLLMHWLKKRLSGSRFVLRRTRRRRAEETVRCWSVLRDADCRSDILTLLKAAYPASADALCFAENADSNAIPLHVMLTLRPASEDAIADFLRRIRESGHARAVIACTQPFSPEARALAMLPDQPSVALIDGDMLAALLTKHPNVVPMRSLPSVRAPKHALSRAHVAKMLPAAAFLLAVYLIFGQPAYLPAAMALLWCALMLLRRKPAPDGLF